MDNAQYQLDRVASKWATELKRDPAQVRREINTIIQTDAYAPMNGLFGEKMVNVLRVNLELRKRYGAPTGYRTTKIELSQGLHRKHEVMEIRRSFNVETAIPRLPKEPVEDLPLLQSRNPEMSKLLEAAARAAAGDATILLTGESGTGKDVLARQIHRWSPRRERPFVVVNCTNLADQGLRARAFRSAASGPLSARLTTSPAASRRPGAERRFSTNRGAHTYSSGTISPLHSGAVS